LLFVNYLKLKKPSQLLHLPKIVACKGGRVVRAELLNLFFDTLITPLARSSLTCSCLFIALLLVAEKGDDGLGSVIKSALPQCGDPG